MALRRCIACGRPISPAAAACPGCGQPIPKRGFFRWIFAAFFLWCCVQVGVHHNDHVEAPVAAENPQREKAFQNAVVGAKLLKKSMRDPDSLSFESVFIIENHSGGTGTACFDYRARNGFGGMNLGRAVVEGNGLVFFTSEIKGFTAIWNRECAGKDGREAVKEIQTALAYE